MDGFIEGELSFPPTYKFDPIEDGGKTPARGASPAQAHCTLSCMHGENHVK